MEKLTCCMFSEWDQKAAKDLGWAGDFEFVLGRCSKCGAYWMSAFCPAVNMGDYTRVPDQDAQKMLSLRPGPELKSFLKEWEKENI